MKHIIPLYNAWRHDSEKTGKKAHNLSTLNKTIDTIPPGFIVSAEVLSNILSSFGIEEEIQSLLNAHNLKTIHSTENASKTIQSLILRAPIPEDIEAEIQSSFAELNTPYVAVRSSATGEDGPQNTYAGQLETYLNSTKKDLISHIKKCWASLFSPRALFYYSKQSGTPPMATAVIVQKMVPAQVSGTIFTTHPITEDENQMIIEAGWGLGEAIVSGEVTPDTYTVTKDPLEIINIHVNHQKKALVRSYKGGNEWLTLPKNKAQKQILSKKDIIAIAAKAITISQHLGYAADIEWALHRGTIYILQARPITTIAE